MSTGSSAQVTRRGVLPRLRDAKIRSKLGLILFVPLVAVVALGAARIVDVVDRATSSGEIQQLTTLSTQVSNLVQLLQAERIAGAQYLGGPKSKQAGYNAAVHETDSAIVAYRDARNRLGTPPSMLAATLVDIGDHLDSIDETRNTVGNRNGITVTDEVSRYGVVINDLIGYDDALSQYASEGDVANGLRALAAFARAKAGAGDQEALAYAGRVEGDNSTEQRTALLAAQAGQQESLLAFSVAADAAQKSVVDTVVSGDPVSLADNVTTSLDRSPTSVAPDDIVSAYGAVVGLMRSAELRLEAVLNSQAAKDHHDAVRQVWIQAGLVGLVLLIALALAVILGRLLSQSLRRLRESALAVATHDLPDVVERLQNASNLSESGVLDIMREVGDPIRLPYRDEIGEVGQAFNTVHREAVRIAAEQAALRTSVSTMFLNLARRSQSLVDRMIGELDQIERNETDPKRLAQLFELDHLATRMRRNDENLLVLAGADSSPPRREDALLVDAMRAAQSEVELYNRIEFGSIDTDIAIASHAVNDVVRLVAELLDNATRFSPPTTVVVADGRRVRDYVVIQVEDRGLGMSDDQMDQLNKRLAEPPAVDVAAFRLMGLAVVSRLAARYGIRVELRTNIEGGTVAQVILPSAIVIGPERQLERSGPPRHATPELGAGSGWEPARSATATLPVYEEPSLPAHPSLPQFPSQRKPAVAPDVTPTPNRPPLPSRVTRAVEERTVTGFGAPTAFSTPTAPAFTTPTAPAPVLPTPPVKEVPVKEKPETHWGAALAAMPAPAPPVAAPVEERTESPIFVEMQQSWFKDHDTAGTTDWGMPTAGRAPEPAVKLDAAPAQPKTAPAPPEPIEDRSNGHSGSVPQQRPAAEDHWQTAADYGWERALAAAAPADAGTTRSGLPKRVPQAQLVPGGVQSEDRSQKRRSPDEIRGLLSAYHRGVQRGRTDGSTESAAASHAVKENEQ